jgi:hypothetical protein
LTIARPDPEDQQRLSKGLDPDLKERLVDGFAIGTEAFREKIREACKDGRETI